MITRILSILVSVVALCVFSIPQTSVASQSEAERYIAESERQWAEAVASGDTAVIDRILADDFVGVDTDGSHYNKAKAVADTRQPPKELLSNHLNEVKIRFYGDAAIAQGNESWERRSEIPKRGRFVLTDTWIRRNGKWQIVAAEDLGVPETSQ
jgi:ketosteroid isomerase-like protein